MELNVQQGFSEEPTFSWRPTITRSYSAYAGLTEKSMSSRHSRVWEAWGTAAGTDGARGEGWERVRGPDTVGPWDFVFYPKL